MKKPINLDQGSFDDEISTGASIVDFYATWCPPCKAVSYTHLTLPTICSV